MQFFDVPVGQGNFSISVCQKLVSLFYAFIAAICARYLFCSLVTFERRVLSFILVIQEDQKPTDLVAVLATLGKPQTAPNPACFP